MEKPYKPRRLKRKERTMLRKAGYNPKYFLVLDKNAENITFIEVTSGNQLPLHY